MTPHPHKKSPPFRSFLVVLAALWLASTPGLRAQQADSTWNTPRALELIARARALRHESVVDSAFQSYHTTGRGFVYFFIDPAGPAQQVLVKTDQAALELWWQAPNETRQRIVGLRDAKTLPTNIRYHLDHLTVVQDEFEDVIKIGDGDEVSAVIHPVAPASEGAYNFRLVDSLTIEFATPGSAPVRVYQIQVRPRDLSLPGFVGSIFLDQASAAIVRMSFTFTPASYVDSSLDYIHISLDNSLWEGKYWLPSRQDLELRRELPALDFLGGSIIRGHFEIGPYDLNVPIEQSVLRLPRISAAPVAERVDFPFEEPIFSQLDMEGLALPPPLAEIQKEAEQIVQDHYLSGLSRLRFFLPSTSDGIRYNRAEGLYGGGGIVLRSISGVTARLQLGYGIGSGRFSGSGTLSGLGSGAPLQLSLFANQLRDLGPVSGSPLLLNSLSSLGTHSDYLDPFFASGARASAPFTAGAFQFSVGGAFERQRSASLQVGDDAGDFRPVRPITDGDLWSADASVKLQPGGAPWSLGVSGRMGHLEDPNLPPSLGPDGVPGPVVVVNGFTYNSVRVDASFEKDAAWQTFRVSLDGHAGLLSRDAPAQELFLLGGRETLLGLPYREFIGDRFWLVRANASQAIKAPWVTGRLFAASGQAELANHLRPSGWSGNGSAGANSSVGAGVSLLWDVLNVDVGRGLGSGGGWSWSVSASQRFQRWL